jgi:hypothetical protein
MIIRDRGPLNGGTLIIYKIDIIRINKNNIYKE